ncbi:hypothetical protein [Mycobacterium sp. UM_Kg27]|uniref:hypothetical protein n=1 Tax=Mycobacterium sp. UM_Kg27 TaxID=1545693 RepID=UPI000A40EF26|nr:hypothetical protein [Mycobacterium sp. UM_Kg27]
MAARRRMIGVTTAVGAFLALGAPVPTAHADIDDLLQPIIDALSGFDPGIAADTGPGFALSSLDTMFDSWYQSLVYTPINELDQWIFGGPPMRAWPAALPRSARTPPPRTPSRSRWRSAAAPNRW